MKHIVLGLFTSVIVLSCSKSIEAPSAIVEADEKTCACFESTASSFKEIRDFYIDNYNSWDDKKIKKEFAERLYKAMKEEQTSKDCIKDWASSKESLWYDYRCVLTEEEYSTEEEYDYASEEAAAEVAGVYDYYDEYEEDYDDYDDYEEAEPIVRSEGRFLLSDVEACYEVHHLMSNNLVDNSDHRQDLEDYILEELAYDENFMRILGNHVGIYLSEYDYERYEREQNRNRDRAYDEE
ncbi:MAG: hypothetical protein VX611_02615 [Bacteroidota bacterium]|nr:hypothetical protein [Bacteroidota bacterium]